MEELEVEQTTSAHASLVASLSAGGEFAPGDWFVVHTYSGYENKVKANLAARIASMNMEDKIYEVIVPTEEVTEMKQGKKQQVTKKLFPGYILVRMELDDDSWYVVRNTPGVSGFLGSGNKPMPLGWKEVQAIISPEESEEDGDSPRTKPAVAFATGDVVSVTDGPFAGMSGPIGDVNPDKQTLEVLVDIFGRETPVTLGFDQVEKI